MSMGWRLKGNEIVVLRGNGWGGKKEGNEKKKIETRIKGK